MWPIPRKCQSRHVHLVSYSLRISCPLNIANLAEESIELLLIICSQLHYLSVGIYKECLYKFTAHRKQESQYKVYPQRPCEDLQSTFLFPMSEFLCFHNVNRDLVQTFFVCSMWSFVELCGIVSNSQCEAIALQTATELCFFLCTDSNTRIAVSLYLSYY